MKKTVKLIVINLLILFLLLVIVDPFLGQEADDPGKLYRSLNMREFGPNRHLVLDATTFPDNQDDSLDHQFYLIKTDNHGFIIGPDDDENANTDIIFFGGSTTECAFVDDSLRFPFLVQKQLNRAENKSIVVRNAGYGGNHTMHSVMNLIGKGLIQKPKWVVLMHNSNDLSQLSKTGTYWKGPGNRALLNESFVASKKSISQRFSEFRNAALMFFVPNITKALYGLKRQETSSEDEWQGMRSESFVGLEEIERQYRNALETFVAIAKANDIQVVLMTQFNRIQPNDKKVRNAYESVQNPIGYDEYVAYYKRFNDVIREVANQENIKIIDLDQSVPHNGKYLIDAVHLNNAGSRFAASVVADSLSAFIRHEDQVKLEESL